MLSGSSEEAAAIPPSARHGALAIIAVAGVLYAVLAGAVLNPLTFFSGDPGVKYLQARNLVESGFRGLAVRNPAAEVDPERRFSALAGNQFSHRGDGPDYGAYSGLFVVPVGVGLALFGGRGMYLVTVLAAVATLFVTYRLAARVAPRHCWAAPLLAGLCSPLAFYAVDLWEHVPATLLTTTAVLLVVSASAAGDVRRFALAGLLLGLAIGMREELYAMLPGGLVALAWVPRGRRLWAAAAAAAGIALALLPHLALAWSHTGLPGRVGVARLLGFAVQASVAESVPESLSRLPMIEMVAPHSPVWAALLAAAVLVRLGLPHAGRAAQGRLLLALVLVAAVWAAAVLVFAVRPPRRPDSLLRAFPAALFLLFLPLAPAAGGWRERRAAMQILAIGAAFVAAMCLLVPFGAQSREEPGGPEWGPRLLVPVYPLLACALAAALEQRERWTTHLPGARAILAGLLAALALSGFALQVRGLRELEWTKRTYERLVAATERVNEDDVIVTTLWWYAAVVAPVLYRHQVVSVDVDANGSLPELLARLDERGRESLTLVIPGPRPSPAHADALARAGWVETARSVVPLWLEVGVLSFRRTPRVPLPGAAPSPLG